MNAMILALALLAAGQVSKEDIKKLTAAGISDEVILSYVKANGGLAKLSAEDVVELKQAGASEKLLTSILSTPAPAPAQQNAVPQQAPGAPAPTTTYVDSTPYYYTPATVYSDYYYPSTYYYPYYSFYPRSYYYSSCYPRSYYYSSCYPRYYTSGVSVGLYGGRYYGRGSVGVSVYRR
jgi:hypothetical protein